MNYRSKFLLPVLILVGLTFYSLFDMTKMIVQGEGFIWLSRGMQNEFWTSIPSSLANFEVSAVLVGTLLSNSIGLQMHLYYFVWLLVIILINILLFIMVFALTKNLLVSFAASLIFAVNYVAQWGVIGWTYTSFLERMLTVTFLIPSFMFLHRYLERSRPRDTQLSVLTFFLAIWFGQWGLVFAGAYIAYPFFWYLFKDKKTKIILIKRILLSSSFVAISALFLYLHSINQAGVGPRYTFTYFLLHPQEFRYVEQIPTQLTRLSQYPVVLARVTRDKPFNKDSLVQYFNDIKGGNEIKGWVMASYLIAAVVIFLKLPQLRPFLFTLTFGVFSLFLVNIYFGRYFPEEQPGPSRFLYFPAVWLSIFWALFLWAVFWQKRGWLSVVGFAILLVYYIVNSLLLSSSFQASMNSINSTYSATKALFSYIEGMSPNLKPNTLILTPWEELGCGEDIFLNDQMGKQEVAFWPYTESNNCALASGGWEKIASDSAQVIRLTYDKECACVIEEKIK